MVSTQKSQEIGIKFKIIDSSNFDKRCSGAHFVSFLFYYYCIQGQSLKDLQETFFKLAAISVYFLQVCPNSLLL